MRVLVLGGSGNIGTSVVSALVADPDITEVRVASRRPTTFTSSRVHWRPVSLTDDLDDALLEGIDTVVHAAWQLQPSRAPRVTHDVNVRGTARVLRAIARSEVSSLVYLSSVGAYSPVATHRTVDETHETHGVATSTYSREKAYVERLLDVFEHRHPERRVVRLRPALVSKRGAASEQRRFFLGALVPRVVLDRRLLPVAPVPAGLRLQLVHSDDVASAVRRAVTGDAAGPFNLAAEPVLDPRAIASVLRARPLELPRTVVRPAAAAAWRLRLDPIDARLGRPHPRRPDARHRSRPRRVGLGSRPHHPRGPRRSGRRDPSRRGTGDADAASRRCGPRHPHRDPHRSRRALRRVSGRHPGAPGSSSSASRLTSVGSSSPRATASTSSEARCPVRNTWGSRRVRSTIVDACPSVRGPSSR